MKRTKPKVNVDELSDVQVDALLQREREKERNRQYYARNKDRISRKRKERYRKRKEILEDIEG